MYPESGIIVGDVKTTICSKLNTGRSRGLFRGGNPMLFATPLLLLQLSLSVFSYAVLRYLLNPLGQTAFLPQILAGLILGPCLGRNATFKAQLFPPASIYIADTLAYFGVILYLFLVGVKMDFSLIRRPGRLAYFVGACTFLFPICHSFFLVAILKRCVLMESKMYESLVWVASFQSVSSSHVILCLLYDLKLMSSDLGRQALSSSIISGGFSLLWTTSVFTGKESTIEGNPGWMLLFMTLLIFAMLVVLVFVLHPLFLWMERNTIDEKSVKESYVFSIFVMILGSAVFSEIVGQHFLFGPMFLGAVVPDGPPLGSAIVTKLDTLVSYILLPVYFVVTCSMLDFTLIRARNFWIILLLAFFASLWKVVGTMLPCFWYKMSTEDALCLGLIMSIQGINDCLVLEKAMHLQLIDKEIFSIMVLCVVLFAGTTSPIIKILYKSAKRYTPYRKWTIEDSDPNAELRLLACLYHADQTPSILNLLEASYPNPRSPICFYVIHLIDLAGRGSPLLLDHHQMRKPTQILGSERILNVLRSFQLQHEGAVMVYPFTAIAPYASMHDDVCSLAMGKKVSMVIVPFHKLWHIHGAVEKPRAVRCVNQNVLKNAPCSVGIIVDRAKRTTAMTSSCNLYRVGVIFIGGGDDREALAFGSRMAKHPNVKLTVLRPIEVNHSNYASESEKDSHFINKFMEANRNNDLCVYREEVMKDSVAVVNIIRQMEKHLDLVIVGRRHDSNSRMLIGLTDWNDNPELGYIGDLLTTSDHSTASVLVVQQHSFAGENILDRTNPPTALNMPWNGAEGWPAL